jgi:hypothetical protein
MCVMSDGYVRGGAGGRVEVGFGWWFVGRERERECVRE